VVMLRFAKVLLVVGALISNRCKICEKNHECQIRGRISQLDVGLSTQTIFLQIYHGVSSRIESFDCRFLVVPEVLKIEM
jgi:hypothetical protein